jgi:hypothetical protein
LIGKKDSLPHGKAIMQNGMKTVLLASVLFAGQSTESLANQVPAQANREGETTISQTALDWIDGDNSISFDRLDGDELDVSYALANSAWWTVIYLDQRVERAFAICADEGVIDVRTDGNVQAISVLPDQCIMLSGYRLDISARQGSATGSVRVVNWE